MVFNFMRRVYTFILYLLIPFILLRLYWKGRRLPAYRDRILERFSIGTSMPVDVDVWLHAVSLGEVVAATPLIDALLLNNLRVLVTTMTPTGSAQVVTRFANKVEHLYVPYDFPWALRRFFKGINTRIGIIMETELWPNLIMEAKRFGIPLVLANARISDKAFKQYEKVRFLFRPLLGQFTAILSQSDLDAKRFIALGAPKALVTVAGNMKFDLQTKAINSQECLLLKQAWGLSRTVLIAASTHDDEENQLLTRLSQLKQAIPDLLLLIAPRHPERFNMVYELSKQHGFETYKRTQSSLVEGRIDVLIIDSIGELPGFYQVSDYAFVGGSLVPIGGHNVLEPIAMNVPVFCGTFMQNSKAICQDLCAAKAMQLVADADALIKALIAMHEDKEMRERQISNATGVLIANQGSVKRHLEVINSILNAG